MNGESNLDLFELSCLANLNPDLSLMCILNYIYHNKFARMIYGNFCDIINGSAQYVFFQLCCSTNLMGSIPREHTY